MKKIFKKINLMALMLILSLALSACSGNSDKGSGDVDSGDSGNKETSKKISIFIPGYEDEAFKSLYDASIEDFRKENSDVTVDIIPAGWDEANSKLVGLIQAGDTPDVIISGSRSLRQFAELGAIAKLDEFMTDEFKAGRVESVLKTANINGSQYGIPLAFSSRALYYRSDLIKTPPTNWDELLETAKNVKKENPDMYGFAIPTDITSGTDEIFNFIYQNGGSATDKDGNIKLNTSENIETLNYLKEFQKAEIIPDPIATSRSSQAPMFQNGDLAMFISGPWEKKIMEENKEKSPYGLAPLPKGKEMAVTLVTDSFSIAESSKNKELAWKLIEFMGQFKYQNAYDEAIGFFPILKEEEKEARYNEEFLKSFKEMIQYGQPEPQVPVWDTFNKEFVESVQKVLTDKATAEEALTSAETSLNK